eukprot:CAMPEP_0179418592 /NCGR_PEP_ID=MMETSP0799-20121207/8099_1 /TAXON_ID=46947 /ORGANISM="Geminigera cryophila, Strain CCMP2564" /LENGTH=182 /DNA_ID=CAMNT_0021191911 /DNA_START=303 /DNA_END=847 /DNA_ORIENTATION=+
MTREKERPLTSAILLVVHEEELELLHVADAELEETIGHQEAGLRVRAVANLDVHGSALEVTTGASIHTVGLAPGLRHALEEIGMPANELVRLLLDDLRPDGRPDAALGTSGHTVYTKRKLTPGCVTICMPSLTSTPGCALHGCTISSRMPTISISCPPSSSCLLTCHSQKAAKQTAVSHSSP